MEYTGFDMTGLNSFLLAPLSPEEQEAMGQRQMGRGNILPREGTVLATVDQRREAHPIYDTSKPVGEMFTGRYEVEPKTYQRTLEAMGFRFGATIDSQLVAAILPVGWRTAPSADNILITRLYDAQNRERATIFFKTTSYDYHAHIAWLQRYSFRTWFAARGALKEHREALNGAMLVCMVVHDNMTGKNVYSSKSFPFYVEYAAFGEEGYEEHRQYTEQKSAAERATWQYFATTYPEHDDPFAYWDDVPALTVEKGGECAMTTITRPGPTRPASPKRSATRTTSPVTTPMAPWPDGTPYPRRLSDAILRGAKLRGQTYQAFYHEQRTCALGAAMEGAFGTAEFLNYAQIESQVGGLGYALRALLVRLQQTYPQLTAMFPVPCPICGMPPDWKMQTPTLTNWVIHLNDEHKLTRERIAHELQKAQM